MTAVLISMLTKSLYLSLTHWGVMRVNVIVQGFLFQYARLGRQVFQEALFAKAIKEKTGLLIDECIANV